MGALRLNVSPAGTVNELMLILTAAKCYSELVGARVKHDTLTVVHSTAVDTSPKDEMVPVQRIAGAANTAGAKQTKARAAVEIMANELVEMISFRTPVEPSLYIEVSTEVGGGVASFLKYTGRLACAKLSQSTSEQAESKQAHA